MVLQNLPPYVLLLVFQSSAGLEAPALHSPSIQAPAEVQEASGIGAALPAEPGIAPFIIERPRSFQWEPALRQSGIFLVIEHGFRLMQPGTRKELRGPFFKDWFASVKSLRGWDDGDSKLANYAGHPLQGAVSGYIYVQNDPRSIYQEFGTSKEYWKSRLRAVGFSTVYSLNFEFGPLSEASIGNVGLEPGTSGMVDHVVTPVGGLALQLIEDSLDRYVIRWVERKTNNVGLRIIARSWLNPSRSFANVLRRKPPWHRDTRLGVTHRYTN